jgi:hypothetical protein
MPDEALKAVAQDYHPSAFFFSEQSERGDVRWVAWSPQLAQLKRLVYALLDLFTSGDAGVLLKVDKQNVADGPVWTRYHGQAPLDEVIAAIRAHERMIFQDGYTQLCVRDLTTADYLALDEYDVLYIYGDDERFPAACRDCGFEQRDEALVSEQGHWRRHIPDLEPDRVAFAERLGLEAVD